MSRQSCSCSTESKLQLRLLQVVQMALLVTGYSGNKACLYGLALHLSVLLVVYLASGQFRLITGESVYIGYISERSSHCFAPPPDHQHLE